MDPVVIHSFFFFLSFLLIFKCFFYKEYTLMFTYSIHGESLYSFIISLFQTFSPTPRPTSSHMPHASPCPKTCLLTIQEIHRNPLWIFQSNTSHGFHNNLPLHPVSRDLHPLIKSSISRVLSYNS